MNRTFDGEAANLMDLAPTILAALGVPKGSAMEGDSLLDEMPTTSTQQKPENKSRTPEPRPQPAPATLEDDEEKIRERLKGLGYI